MGIEDYTFKTDGCCGTDEEMIEWIETLDDGTSTNLEAIECAEEILKLRSELRHQKDSLADMDKQNDKLQNEIQAMRGECEIFIRGCAGYDTPRDNGMKAAAEGILMAGDEARED